MSTKIDCKHYSKYKVCMHPKVPKDRFGFNKTCLLVDIPPVDARLIVGCKLKEAAE